MIFHSVLYSDCANVAHQSGLPETERYSGKRTYSGMILQASSCEGQLVEDIVKVKAHLSLEEEGLSARERLLRKRDSDADIGAKHGLLLHPSAPEEMEEVTRLVDAA
eukprot:8689667-Pyramimonas_sp.AAC.1